MQRGRASGPFLAAAVTLVAAAGGVVIGHYSWTTADAATAARPVAPKATSGTPPNRLDANANVVLSAPRIRNLFWDDGWNSRSGHAGFHRGAINLATEAMTTSGYLAPTAQYGVGAATWRGSFTSSPVCGPTRAPTTVSAAAVTAWVTCMVTAVVTGVPAPSPRIPVSNDLYMVYLPSRTSISDNLVIPRFTVLGQSFGPLTILIRNSCLDFGAYHSFSATVSGLFPYAVVPTRCFRNATNPLDRITRVASHEIVEAATDPLPQAGRIDNSLPTAGSVRLSAGEAADICSSAGAMPTGAVRRTGPAGPGLVKVPVSVLVSPYWSNSAGACVTSNAG